MPQKLDTLFEHLVDRAHSRHAEFPAKQLSKGFSRFLDENVSANDADLLRAGLAPLLEIMDKYSEGLKAHEFNVFASLLQQYYDVESLFSLRQARDEEVILKLREENKDKVASVVHTVLSHTRVGAKNNLIIAILDTYRPNRPGAGQVARYFRPSLRKLAELESRATAKVALKAREVLIQCAMPSLEERTSQMEHILRSSVLESRYGESGWDHREPNFDVIKEVVDSKFTVFDVLPHFFVHQDPWVSLAALEVYTRRAYRAYKLKSIDYNVDRETPYVLSWDFSLRKVGESEYGLPIESSHPSAPTTPSGEGIPKLSRIHSISDMSYLAERTEGEPTRKGAVVPIQYLDEAEEYLQKALDIFPMAGQKDNKLGRNTSSALMADLSKR
ncbi:hypothetical protein LTR28_001707, partial [Elasticomyces elasticus]